MALSNYPDWVLKYKKPGQEIRCRNERYYVYECKCVYNKETHRPKKVTGKYLGTISEADGFVEAKRRMVLIEKAPQEALQETLLSDSMVSEKKMIEKRSKDLQYGEVDNLEYGFYHFFEKHILNTYIPKLKTYFPQSWQTIVAMSYCRAMYKSPLKRMEADFRKSYMSVYLKDAKLSPKYLTSFIRDLGRNHLLIIEFCKSLYDGSSSIIFDGTDVLSSSNLMGINKYSKTKKGTYDYVFNLMNVFSIDQRIPIYYHLLPGSIKDVSAFSECLDTVALNKEQTAIIIDPDTELPLDKGFASEENFSKLEKRKLNYIIALKRSDKHITYDCLEGKDYSGMDGAFQYEGRLIGYKMLGAWDDEHPGRKVYLYYDKLRENQEDSDYRKRHIDEMTTKEGLQLYSEKFIRFGTLGLVSTSDVSAEKIYNSYKNRNMVEDMISVDKTDIGLEATYMQDEVALQGWLFPLFLGLLWHFTMRNHIVDSNMIKKYSPRDVFRAFDGVRKIKISGQWKLTRIIKNDQKLLKKLSLLPPNDEMEFDTKQSMEQSTAQEDE